jgi:uncharacterized protein (DUF1501 family)
MTLSRRDLLKLGGAGIACACLPGRSLAGVFARLRFDASGRVLVLLQLSGGNDGLSTVVPFADDVYHRSRKATRILPGEVLKIDDHVGLNPGLGRLKALYDQGSVAIIQGAGYPNPNRSHFESMDIWHTAATEGRAAGSGWVGRFADLVPEADAGPDLVIHLGAQLPYSLQARKNFPIAFQTPDAYKWIGGPDQVKALEMASSRKSGAHLGRDAALDKIRQTLQEAHASSAKVREAAQRYKPKAQYPRSPLAGSLYNVAALIAGGLETRVFSVETGGFDTHVSQRGSHDLLMTQLGDAIAAFMKDLAAQGFADRVVILAFSEFGRRLVENASGGTDHGVAGPMFAIGPKVKGGLYSTYPSLTDLDRGDLKHTVDFRCAYATVIDRWLGASSADVLGARFDPVGFL